jgi:hypothetical protein
LILTLGTHLSIASFSLETNTVHCSSMSLFNKIVLQSHRSFV